jgi:hypothetical protein
MLAMIYSPPGGKGTEVRTSERLGGNYSRWHRDGKELLYLSRDRNLMAASVRSVAAALEFTTPVALFRTAVEPNGPHIYTYDISPDGQRILTITTSAEHTAALTLYMNWQAKLTP